MTYTAQASDLCLLADVKEYLGLTVGTADNMLQRMITAASTWIKSWSNRDYFQQTYAQTLDGNDSTAIALDQYPITAVASLTIDGTVVLPANFTWDNSGQPFLILTDGTLFNKGKSNIVVSYTAGFGNIGAGTIPQDVQQACIELVAWRYTERSRIQQNSKSMGGEVVSFSTAEGPRSAMVLLTQYKRVIP